MKKLDISLFYLLSIQLIIGADQIIPITKHRSLNMTEIEPFLRTTYAEQQREAARKGLPYCIAVTHLCGVTNGSVTFEHFKKSKESANFFILPPKSNQFIYLGVIQNQQYGKKVKLFFQANEQDSIAQLSLGVLFANEYNQKRNETSYKLAERFLKLSIHNQREKNHLPYAYFEIAELYHAAGNIHMAIEHMNNAYSISPLNLRLRIFMYGLINFSPYELWKESQLCKNCNDHWKTFKHVCHGWQYMQNPNFFDEEYFSDENISDNEE